MKRALDDIFVIEVGSGWPISIAGRVLAELGATVVKIEEPAGDSLRRAGPLHSDGQSWIWHSVCAGKRSIVVDPDSSNGRQFLLDLAAAADVILSDGVSFGFSEVEGVNREDLIFATLTPFGLSPRTDWKSGCDGVIQASAGIIATTGFPSGQMTRAGCGLADHVGAFYVVTAILAALLHRDYSGRGQTIDMSSCDCLMTLLLLWLPKYFMTGGAPTRQGNRHLSSVPWNAYRTADSWVMMCTSTDAQWLRLYDLMGRPDLTGGPYDTLRARMDAVELIDEIVAEWLSAQSTDHVINQLHQIGVPVGRIFTISEMLNDKHTRFRRTAIDVPDLAGGKVRIAGPLCKMSKTPGVIDKCGPGLGADNTRLREELNERLRDCKPKKLNIAPQLGEIKIIESGVFGAGPFATKLLAELGMKVIKLESLEGDGMRHYQPQLNGTAYPFHLYNANKHSISLDLKSPAGVEHARELINSADVYLENLGPGVIDRLGLGFDSFSKSNPELVYCSVSGFGRVGPYAGNRAYDTVIQAMSGIMSVTGEDRPTKIGVSAADILGPIFACIPILAALHNRNRTREGQWIDVSMHDVCAATTQSLWPVVWQNGDIRRTGNQHQYYVPYNNYPTTTDDVFIGVEDDQQWASLAELIGLRGCHEWSTTAGRIANRDAVNICVAAWTKGQAAEAIANMCQSAGVPASPLRSIEGVMQDPRMAERNMIVEIQHVDGMPLILTGSPFKMSVTPGQIVRGGPPLNDFANPDSAQRSTRKE
ncbi:CaiB/BaiF CoA transferase family protein [Pseudorhodoplanes sp.]|uniref:CaiB/BaiF CoA transferase family protein n=1 Tax=Pseudorhodoplanes sp. TaxID=1934341 RepID=UPI003D1207BD